MSAKYKSPSFLLPNEKNTSLSPSLSTDRASMYSMDFDGTKYISISNPAALTDDFTISAWIFPTRVESVLEVGADCFDVFFASGSLK